MIPTIGFVVCAYVFTRSASMLADKEEPALVRIFATLTLLVAALGGLVMLAGGVGPQPVPSLR